MRHDDPSERSYLDVCSSKKKTAAINLYHISMIEHLRYTGEVFVSKTERFVARIHARIVQIYLIMNPLLLNYLDLFIYRFPIDCSIK